MTPRYTASPDERGTKASQPLTTPAATIRRGRGKAKRVGGIKSLIAIASVATTVGGWAMFANHDAATATQATAAPTQAVSLVSQISASAAPTDTATAIITATPTSTPTALATAISQALQQSPAITPQASAAQATATTAEATATSVPPTATATTAPPAATPTTQVKKVVPTAVTTTRSSR